MSYGSMAQATNIVKAFDFYDRLTLQAKAICNRYDIGPMQIMECGLDKNGRSGLFTGTDLPKMMGLLDAKYGDMRTVLAEKLGLIDPEFVDNTPVRVGKFLEPLLASMAIEEMANVFRACEDSNPKGRFYITMGEFHRHPTLCLGASTDMCLWFDDLLVAICEFKHTGADWEDETPPDKVMVQVQAQLMCTDKSAVHVFAITGGNRSEKHWIVKPDPTWIKDITEAVTEGAKVLEAKKLPAVITYKKPESPKKKPEPRLTATMHRYASLCAKECALVKLHEARADRMKKQLGKFFKDFESGKGDGWSAYRTVKTFEPKMSAEKALPSIEKALFNFIPAEKWDEALKKVEEIKKACTSDGSQRSEFTFKPKGEA